MWNQGDQAYSCQEQSCHIQKPFVIQVRNYHNLYSNQVLTNAFGSERKLTCSPLLTKADGRVPGGSPFPISCEHDKIHTPPLLCPSYEVYLSNGHSVLITMILSSTPKSRAGEGCEALFAEPVSVCAAQVVSKGRTLTEAMGQFVLSPETELDHVTQGPLKKRQSLEDKSKGER